MMVILFGGDLPSWFYNLFDNKFIYIFAESRGEYIHARCPHYQTCFIEYSIRKTEQSGIIIANHALIINHFAWSLENIYPDWEKSLPSRLIFDKAHHLADAADTALFIYFSIIETSELQPWYWVMKEIVRSPKN